MGELVGPTNANRLTIAMRPYCDNTVALLSLNQREVIHMSSHTSFSIEYFPNLITDPVLEMSKNRAYLMRETRKFIAMVFELF